MSIRHTVYRTINGEEDTPIEVEATGTFVGGELDEFERTSDPPVELTPKETDAIWEKLVEDYADDWDENGWQADREMSDA